MESVRWGVLGCARVFERRMVPGFRAVGESATLVAVASRSQEKAQAVAARHGIPRAYGSYEALLADTNIEAVYIPLPNDQHTEWTLRALQAGKHVLCDKPGALTLVDAVEAANLAQSLGLRLMEAFMYRHHPQHTRIAAIIASGEIGTPTHFESTFAYPAPRDEANIRWNPDQGGGALLDTGVYALNAARLHFGEPVAVSAVARIDSVAGVDVHTIALLEEADERTACVQGSFDQIFASAYVIRGDRGSVICPRAFQVGEAGVTIVVRVGDDTRTEALSHVDQYALEIAHFSACVRDRMLPLAPGENGVAQARLVEAVRTAARERRRVLLAELSAAL